MLRLPSQNTSYPPLFRGSNPTLGTLDPPLAGPTVDLPFIDIQNLTPTSLGDVCKDWGIFRLINHEIPPTLAIQIQEEAKKLLSHPFESKQTPGFFPPPISYFWDLPGFTRNVAEPNWLEGLGVPLGELQSGRIDSQDSNLNDSSFRFRSLVEEFARHLAPISRALLKTLAVELELEGGRLPCCPDETQYRFQVNRYLCSTSSDKHLGFQPHTDSSIFTILDQDDVGGLQMLRNSMWFNIPPIPNTLIVIIGDMIQAISDGKYKSVKHRVLASRSTERVSIAYGTYPTMDAVIASSKYRPFVFKEFRAQMGEDLRTLGFTTGLNNFKVKEDTHASES